jgi:hypothetical protein
LFKHLDLTAINDENFVKIQLFCVFLRR